MSELEISRRYARALYQLAEEGGALDSVYEAVTQLSQAVQQAAPLRDFLANPLLDQQERHNVVAALFEGKVPPVLFKFLLYVNAKARLAFLKPILQAFDDLYVERHNRLRAHIQTALPLDEEVKGAIRARLSSLYGREIVPQWSIRKDLLGGFRIFIAGNLHDYSFTSQLKKFKQEALH